ncbi:S53 family peptidase [Phaeacidiphilus oryzae]|uniref:S53 family peptidase n=1 Tax=Phaeacidiphilus oryzae TaxID=348818 RepID=UPI00056C2F07|nr:S53 family peptidase [Phaeacidiphilus oryzae]
MQNGESGRARSRRGISPRRAAVAIGATLPLFAAALAAAGPAEAAQADTARATLSGTHPNWAKSSADQGGVSSSTQLTARVYLAGRDQADLAALAEQVSDPSSASYRHYLTAAQVKQRFEPSAGQIAAVRSWLTKAGFTVTGANSHYLTVRGSAAAAQTAFATPLHNYRTSGGATYRAPARTASVPASIAGDVLSVTGLNDKPTKATHQDKLPGPAAAFVNAGPFSSYYGQNPATSEPKAFGQTQSWTVKGYTGSQLRSAYGVTGSGLTGQGVKVAVIDAYDSPTIDKDVRTYASRNGDQAWGGGQLTHVDAAKWTHTGTDSNGCGASGWYGEQTLDLEAVHAIAPKAGVTYVGAASCYDADLVDALNTVVDNHLADIVSNSWGEPEAASDPSLDAVYNQTFMKGALEGIGFYFSSGDNGDEVANTGTKQSDMPASLSWVTAVGGTSLAAGKGGRYEFETGWGTGMAPLSADGKSWQLPGAFHGGAGGGTSARTAEPFYQRGVVPSSLSGANGGSNRVVPDIAAVADPNTGFLEGITQTYPDGSVKYGEYRIGGTSLACPLIAGIQALAQQAAGHPLGFADPAIYARYGSRTYHDVTDHPLGSQGLAVVRNDYNNTVDASQGITTTLRTLGHDASLSATGGYDDVTGVGSPTAAYLWSYARH